MSVYLCIWHFVFRSHIENKPKKIPDENPKKEEEQEEEHTNLHQGVDLDDKFVVQKTTTTTTVATVKNEWV